MNYLSKVSLEKGLRRAYTIKIAAVGSICLIGLILGIVSLTSAKYLFALWYFIAFILGLFYVVIRINTAFPTYIAADSEKLILSSWKNGVMPYTLPENPTFVSDFIPDKVVTREIVISEIDCLFIGSKKFLKRNLTDSEYPEILTRLEVDKHFEKVIKRMDFIAVRLKDGNCCFMSVTGFDITELALLIETIEKNCAGVSVHTNLPKLVKIRSHIIK